MNEEQLIDLLNDTRHEPQQMQAIKTKLLHLLCVSGCPDLTDVWNLACFLSQREQITVWEMNKVWGALRELQEENKIRLADLEDSD